MMTSKRRLHLVLEERADVDIRRRDDWWKRERGDAPMLFAQAVRAAYKELRRTQTAGLKYDEDGVEGVRRYLMRETQHWLYFTVIDEPPLQPYILVLGLQGPGQNEAPNLTRRRSP